MSVSATERSLSDEGAGFQPDPTAPPARPDLPNRTISPVARRQRLEPAKPTESPKPAPAATPDPVRLVKISCLRLAATEAAFAQAFHRAMAETVPGLRPMSPDRQANMSAGLAHCVLWAALTSDPPEAVVAFLRQVGADHYRQGFPCDSYQDVGRALLHSVRDSLGNDWWDSRLSSAWVSYGHWLESQLRTGSDRARDAGGAPLAAAPISPEAPA